MVATTNDSSHDSCSDSTHDIYRGGWGVVEILNANTFLKIHSTLRLLNDFTGVMECGRGYSREEFESGVQYNRYNSYLSSHCHTNNNTTV